jgi:hypothetical protein
LGFQERKMTLSPYGHLLGKGVDLDFGVTKTPGGDRLVFLSRESDPTPSQGRL